MIFWKIQQISKKRRFGFAQSAQFCQKFLCNFLTEYIHKIIIEWNDEKNELIKQTHGLCFEQIQTEIEAKRYVGPEANPNHEGQYRVIVKIDDYPVAVPFVVTETGSWFLKTAYFCRKMKGRI